MKEGALNGHAQTDPESEILDYSLVKARTKSLSVAYVLCIFFGIFGLHHFYLRRLGYGITYTCTGGLLFMGWIVDLFRLPTLVRSTNDKIILSSHDGIDLNELEKEKFVSDAYVMYLPPFGLLGFHHFYLNRFAFGVLYIFTFGLFGFGWLLDFFRMSYLVMRANRNYHMQLRDGANYGEASVTKSPRKRLDDAIVLSYGPAGILGFHHIYLENLLLGFFYIITIGNCGICWVADMFRIPQLVQKANNEIDKKLGGLRLNTTQAYLLWLPPAGFLGAHQFYLQRPCSGLIRSATLGLFLVGWVYDFFKIQEWVKKYNLKQELQECMTEVELELTQSEKKPPKAGGYDPDMFNPFKYCLSR